jgi:hypothetical protein
MKYVGQSETRNKFADIQPAASESVHITKCVVRAPVPGSPRYALTNTFPTDIK